MNAKLADRKEETFEQIRWGALTSSSPSPPQAIWRGPPPQGVDKVLSRDALEQHFRPLYAKWASNFALLSEEFLGRVFEAEVTRIKQLVRGAWKHNPFADCGSCKVGTDYLWVQKQERGWTIELCYPGADPDVRILTIENMPVLCPEGIWGARLALACYPTPPANFVWRPFW